MGLGRKSFWEEELKRLLKDVGDFHGSFQAKRLAGDGSDREFYRLINEQGKSLILVFNPKEDEAGLRENRAYIKIGKHFEKIPDILPKVYASSDSGHIVLVEDLGDTRLHDILIKGLDVRCHYEEAIERLLIFQDKGLNGFHTRWCAQTETYDETVMFELECMYFKRAFLRDLISIDVDEERILDCFRFIVSKAAMAQKDALIHRDFQSRNIMISPKGVRFVDWQGARIGPSGYDLASIVLDPYASLSQTERVWLIETYERISKGNRRVIGKNFFDTFPYLMLLRNLQIIGAFAYLFGIKKKSFFKDFIQPGLCSLTDLLCQINEPKLCYLKEKAVESEEVWARQKDLHFVG